MANTNPAQQIIERMSEVLNGGETTTAIMEALGEEIKLFNDNVDYVYSTRGVLTCESADLDSKFGTLTNIPREVGESDTDYIERMVGTLNTASGGTHEAIRIAAAIALGVDASSQFARDRIIPINSWLYTGTLPNSGPGYAVCYIEWDSTVLGEFDGESTRLAIEDSLTRAKALGVRLYVVIDFKIVTYTDLETLTYTELENLAYTELGRLI